MNQKFMALPLAMSAILATGAQAEEFFIKSAGDYLARAGFVRDSAQGVGSIFTAPGGYGDAIRGTCLTGTRKFESNKSERYVMKVKSYGGSFDVQMMAMGVFGKETLENAAIKPELKRVKQVEFDNFCHDSYIKSVTKGGVMFLSLSGYLTGSESISDATIIANSADEANAKIAPVLEIIQKNYHISGSGVGFTDPRAADKIVTRVLSTPTSVRAMTDYVDELLKTPESELIRLQDLSVNAEKNPARPKLSRWDRVRSALGM